MGISHEEYKNLIRRCIHETPLEGLIEVFRQGYGDLTLDYLDVFASDSDPNPNHLALAMLAEKTRIKRIVTMNFDLLIETAMKMRHIPSNSISPLNDYKLITEVGHPIRSHMQILKPHGSISEPTEEGKRVKFIATALDELGEQPQKKNRLAMDEFIRDGSTLIFAGYNSGADWDVFPIVREFGDRLHRIYWVRFDPKENFSDDVEEFLNELGPSQVWVLDGNVTDLFDTCLALLGVRPPERSSERITHDMDRRAYELFSIPQLNDFALGQIMQRRNQFEISRTVYDTLLQDKDFVYRHPAAHARMLMGLAYANHTPERITYSISFSQKACQAFDRLGESYRNEKAYALVWLAYEYICAIKPDRLVYAILKLPWDQGLQIIKGHYYSKARICCILATKSATKEERKQIVSLCRYYFADLLHCWANLTLLPLPGFGFLRRRCHRSVLRRYFAIRRSNEDYMTHGYYWLRELECRLVGETLRVEHGVVLDRLRKRILSWDRSYVHTGNVVEGANAQAYLAMLEYKANNIKKGDDHLEEAKNRWSAYDSPSRSGLMRVALFECYLRRKDVIGGMIAIAKAALGHKAKSDNS